MTDASALKGAAAGRLRAEVEMLAGRIGERSVFKPAALAQAREHIEGRLSSLGYQPRLHTFRVRERPVHNVVAERAGSDPAAPPVLIGAHYDTAPGTPGADDNASGVAALLELAASLREAAPRAGVRLVFFANEEPPFFGTRDMGSWRYARDLRDRGEAIEGMLSLEMLGCYAAEPGTQSYPPGVGWFYPDRGDFIALVGDLASTRWVRRVREALGGRFPLQSACLPRWMPGVDFSDHWGFWEAGYPAAMLTDTAFYRNAHYHQPTDTPERLDYGRLAAFTEALGRAVVTLT